MAKPEQVIVIQPEHEIKFNGPFNVPVTSFIKLSNPTDNRVMFKIKTTAPKKYCVRPNSGVLEPGSTIEIAICLQPFHFDPQEKNKHKFMVQTAIAPQADVVNFEQAWKEIKLEDTMDSKLKCVFELPPEQNETDDELLTRPSEKGWTEHNEESNSVQTELQKLQQEVQQLREEERALRKENVKLLDECLTLKREARMHSHDDNVAFKYVPPPIQPQNPTVLLAVVGVVVAVVGIVLGKFVL